MTHHFKKLFVGFSLTIISFYAFSALPALLDGKKLPSLAPMLKNVVPAVVNIATESSQTSRHPFFNDPIYRRFYQHQLPKNNAKSLGSGVIINAQKGYILTNSHVIKKATKITVILHDKRRFLAKVIGTDPATDIAVIQIKATKLTQIPLANSDTLQVGDFVVAIGNPFGLGQSVTSGIVSALGRSGLGIEGYEDFIQTDASINPGNSGGPLVNLRGELVGLNTAILSKSGSNIGIGFAIPANMVRNLTGQILKYGQVKRGLLGVHIQNLTPKLSRALGINTYRGAVVARIQPGSSAQRAGILLGDVIIKVNDKTVKSAGALRNKIGLMRVGQSVKLTLIRQGKTKIISASLGALKPRMQVKNLPQSKPDTRLLHKHLSGIYFRNLPQRGGGVMVAAINTQSPAWNAGLRRGDIVVSVNRRQVRNMRQFKKVIAASRQSILLNIRRGRGALYIYLE